MKLIPKWKWYSVSLTVMDALENEDLLLTEQETLIKEELKEDSNMFKRW
ncbi:MAG: hypothetical protein ACYDCP_05825 [Thermoplasmataceae archaeon]